MEPTSSKFNLNSVDWKKWLNNTLVFISPVALIYLITVAGNIQKDGLSLSDFTIDTIVAGAMILYVVNVLIDLFRKFAKDNTPK